MMISRTTTASPSKALSASDFRKPLIAWALAAALLPAAAFAQNLPTGGTVTHGAAQITTPSANSMVINQGSDRAVVNWDGFSIGAGSSVNINQPTAESAILNRVTGDTTSQIHGQLNANGRVFVVNPNGIFIGKTGHVNTGSFVASTLGIRSDDFITGQTVFEGDGASATVSNAGTVEVVTGGYAALIGGKVRNSGTIQAPLGFVGLGSGERITLDLAGDGFLQVAIPTNSEDDGLEALIENSGTIQANGGTVQISAATARNAARHAINMSGVVEARSVSGRNGRVTLGGGGGGTVRVTGKVRTNTYRRPAIQVTQSARPTARPERGGDITITGREIALAGADIDASGADGGGTIRIGGAYQGGPDLPTADTLNVDAGSVIKADGLRTGDGGRVILWSDQRTDFAGNISARGGEVSGNGGFVEVSGKVDLTFGGRADLRADAGDWGELLIDPTDIEIVSGVAGVNQLTNTFVETQLGLGGFTISTAALGGTFPDSGEPGVITVDAPLSWPLATGLTLIADSDIIINEPITPTGGFVNLFTFGGDIAINNLISTGAGQLLMNVAGGDVSTGPQGDIDVGTFTLNDGTWSQIGTDFPGGVLPDFDADNFVIGAGGTFVRLLDDNGGLGPGPLEVTDIYGLQGVLLAGGAPTIELANDIDASPTQTWISLDPPTNGVRDAGFVPSNFDGILNGNRFTISDLFIRRHSQTPFSADAGLIDTIGSTAFVGQLNFTNADVAGGTVGIVAAENDGNIFGVSVDGTVTHFNEPGEAHGAGGVVGENNVGATIIAAASSVTITDAPDPSDPVPGPTEDLFIGGVAGSNAGRILGAKFDGAASYDAALIGRIGGIAGSSFGDIENAYSTGSVAADTNAGTSGHAGSITGSNGTGGVILNTISNGPVSLVGGNISGGVGAVTGTDDPSDQSVLASFYSVAGTGQAISGENGENNGFSPGIGQPFEGAIPDTVVSLTDAPTFTFGTSIAGWDLDFIWSIPDDGVDQARLFALDPVITARDDGSPIAPVQYTGQNPAITTGMPVYAGGTSQFAFGPLNDTGDLSVLDNQVAVANPNVGATTYAWTGNFTSDLGQVYEVRSLDFPLTITPAPLTITVGDVDKPFGTELAVGSVPIEVVGLFPGDSITGFAPISDGAPAETPISGPTFDINVGTFEGSGIANYTINQIPGRLRVIPRTLDIILNSTTKTYGETLVFDGTEFTTVGLLNDDTLTTLTITSDGAPAEAQVADSPFDIVGTGPVGTGLENYVLNIVPGTLTILPAPLTITADNQDKPFGTEFIFAGNEFTVTGLLNEDRVDSAVLSSIAAPADAPFTGPEGEAILITDPAGLGLDNYEITLVNGIMIVAPGNVTITANDQTKVYGETFTFNGTEFTVTGLAEGDSVDSVTLTSAGTSGTAQVADGPFLITPSDPVGTGLEKYTLIFADGSFTVVPAPLTVTAEDQMKQQGQLFTFAGTEFTTAGLLNGDSVDSAFLASDGAEVAALADDSPFAITVGDLSGTGLSNYDVATVDGTFTVQNLIDPPITNPVPGGNSTLPNPPDIIPVGLPDAGPSGSSTEFFPNPGSTFSPGIGGTLIPGSGGVQNPGDGTGGPQQSLPDARATLDVVDTISTELELAVDSCGSAEQDFTNYMNCLSESLDTYANALDEIANDLPEGLENVSATIRTASARVKAATARATQRLAGATTAAQRRAIQRDAVNEARSAIAEAKTEIRKAISLIRADDPEVTAVQRQTGARIIQAFDSVDSALVRAVEL